LLNPDIDYQISMGSLGQWLRTDEDSFKESKKPYLIACANRSAKIKKRYQKLADGRMLVGISWKGGNREKESRTIPLEQWADLLAADNCCFINIHSSWSRRNGCMVMAGCVCSYSMCFT